MPLPRCGWIMGGRVDSDEANDRGYFAANNSKSSEAGGRVAIAGGGYLGEPVGRLRVRRGLQPQRDSPLLICCRNRHIGLPPLFSIVCKAFLSRPAVA